MLNPFFSIVVFVVLINSTALFSGWGEPPEGWDDYVVGLINDHKDVYEIPMNAALDAGIRIDYRYAYINAGPDPATNAISWLFTEWFHYVEETPEGMSPAFVIYMLQEEGGVSALKNNANNTTYMKSYFTSIKFIAEESNGTKAIFILEPDTWGYALQSDQQAVGANVLAAGAQINNLGYSWLTEFDNKIGDITDATIKTVREFAPDAYVGVLANFWSLDCNGATGDPVVDGNKGMVYWNIGDVEYSARKHAEFFNNMLDGEDKGDFIAVEKKGLDAGFYLANSEMDWWYWDDEHMEKYLYWAKTLAQGVDLPLVGWQISIAHMGLPNVNDRYEDTFMPYFFEHVNDFLNTGFIGFLVGEGLPQGTNYSMTAGEGDDGWFFEHLGIFDEDRPYNLNLTTSIKKDEKITKNKFFIKGFSTLNGSNIEINIGLNQENRDLSVNLFNVKGEKIISLFNGKIENSVETISLGKNRYPAGIYFINVKTEGIEKAFKVSILE